MKSRSCRKIEALILLIIPYALVFSSCAQEPISFPQELFKPQVSNSPGECAVALSNVYVTIPDVEPIIPVLHIDGSQTSECQELKFKQDPPNWKKQIYIELSGASSKTKIPDIGSERAFSLSINLVNLIKGNYAIWINGNISTEFSVP